MIIQTVEELRHYLPSHVLSNLDTMSGFLDNSENDFLAERIGKPLLKRLRTEYKDIMEEDEEWSLKINDLDYEMDEWQQLLMLCQRCIVFDAFARAADIHAISINQAGINVAETDGYDAANDKSIDKYKAQLNREAHAASNRLLVQLEEWQKEVNENDNENENDNDNTTTQQQNNTTTEETPNSSLLTPNSKAEIVELWKQSAYYYFADGLLLNTASDFGRYVNIYDSREKFIQLLPDIRYCQETFIENEIGIELLQDLIGKHRTGKLNDVEAKVYVKLQRILSLQTEARSKVIYRKEAKDEAIGHMRNTLDYMRKHQTSLDEDAVKESPIYDARVWNDNENDNDNENENNKGTKEQRNHPHSSLLTPHSSLYDLDKSIRRDPRFAHPEEGDGMLISSLI